ncbi:hypothetical protein GQX74_013836 [Glossina fuscipes]|nr:hypothetical protein GQX74_013836 [Glossina fuscipes]
MFVMHTRTVSNDLGVEAVHTSVKNSTNKFTDARCCCLLLSEASEAISVFSSLSFDDDDDDDDDDVNVASRRELSKLRAPIEKKLSNHCLSSSLSSDATDVDDVSISSSEISRGNVVVVSISLDDSVESSLREPPLKTVLLTYLSLILLARLNELSAISVPVDDVQFVYCSSRTLSPHCVRNHGFSNITKRHTMSSSLSSVFIAFNSISYLTPLTISRPRDLTDMNSQVTQIHYSHPFTFSYCER